jgi:NTP pyrophosphatase (non-canonical NTP hydrolase)
MEFSTYQHVTKQTAIYPESGCGTPLAIAYVGLGVAGEAGEVVGKIKKMLRDDDCILTEECKIAIGQEIGGVLWYLSQIANEIGLNLDDIARENLDILADRKNRGVIKGSGDNR